MLNKITGILISLCLLASLAGHAQSPGDTDTGETASSREQPDEEQPEPEQDSTDAETRPETAESFSPTEQISEDLSVPFPVDI